MNERAGLLEQVQGQHPPLFIEAFRVDDETPAISSSEQLLQAAASGAGRLIEAVYRPYVPIQFHESPRATVGDLLHQETDELKQNPGYHLWPSPDGSGFEWVVIEDDGFTPSKNLSYKKADEDTVRFFPLTHFVEDVHGDITRIMIQEKLPEGFPEELYRDIWGHIHAETDTWNPRSKQVDYVHQIKELVGHPDYGKRANEIKTALQDVIPMLPDHWYSYFSIFDATGAIADKSLYLLALDDYAQTFTVVGLDHGRLMHTAVSGTSGAPLKRFYLIPPSLYPGAIVHDAYTGALKMQRFESGKVVIGQSGAPITLKDLSPQILDIQN